MCVCCNVVLVRQLINISVSLVFCVILLNCGTLTFDSYTSNLLEQMFDIQRYIRILTIPRLFSRSNPRGPQQILSLGISPIDNADPCYPPQEACKWVTVPISFNKNHSIFNVSP